MSEEKNEETPETTVFENGEEFDAHLENLSATSATVTLSEPTWSYDAESDTINYQGVTYTRQVEPSAIRLATLADFGVGSKVEVLHKDFKWHEGTVTEYDKAQNLLYVFSPGVGPITIRSTQKVRPYYG